LPNSFLFAALLLLNLLFALPLFPSAQVLFQDKVKNMLAEIGEAGIELPGEQPADMELWELWKSRQSFRNKRDRVMLNRFQACIVRAEKELPFWSMDLFEREYVGLELDMLRSKKLRQRIVVKSKDRDAGEGAGPSGSTSKLKLHFEDKSLRSVADNAVGISVALLDDYENRRITECIVYSLNNLKQWRVEMIRQCRSSSGHRDFLINMCSGGAWKHATEAVGRLANKSYLKRMRFLTEFPEAKPEPTTVMHEDNFAELVWKLVMGSLAGVVRRFMMFWGLPHGFAGLLSDSTTATKCVQEFQQDVEIFDELKSMSDLQQNVKKKVDRHVLNLVGVQQYEQAFKELGFTTPVHPDIVELARKRSTGTFTTNLEEEIVGIARNSKEAKTTHRYRRPEVLMGRVLASKRLETAWQYDWVNMDKAIDRGSRLSAEAFKPKQSSWSLPFKEIQGTGPVVGWYSPSHQNFTVPQADRYLWRDCKALGDLSLAENTWLGKAFSWKHLFCFEYIDPKNKEKFWVYPILHFADSAILAVRLKRIKIPTTDLEFFDIVLGDSPLFISMVSLSDACLGMEVAPRSWAWQVSNMSPKTLQSSKLQPAVRLFAASSVKRVKAIICENAFWLMTKNEVEEFASYFGHAIDKGSNLCQALSQTLKAELKCGAKKALGHVAKRMSNLQENTKFSSALMEIDDAIYCLDIHDHQEMEAAKKSAWHNLSDCEAFQEEYRRSVSSVEKPPKLKPGELPLEIQQHKVKDYCPPGSRVWRGNIRAEWWGQLPPYKCVWSSLKLHGGCERSAVRDMLQQLWDLYNLSHGLPKDTCPITGVFVAKPPTPAE
jgi:hypothetical protein